MNEVWRDIVGFEGIYQVSDLGRVKSMNYRRTGVVKILTPTTKNSYPNVRLRKNGKSTSYYVHRLVAQAFIPNPSGLCFINHKDESRSNNTVSNLEWCTQEYNNRYGSHPEKISLANSKAVLQSLNGKIVREWSSCTEAHRDGGYSIDCISRCCTGKRKTHAGYEWCFAT